MNSTTRVLLTAVLCTAAVACSKKVKEVPPVDTGTTAPVTDTGPAMPGAYGPEDLDTDACLRQRTIYFDLDQDVLRPEFQAAVGCHAKYLRDRPSSRMTLEATPTSVAAASTTSPWVSVAATRSPRRSRPTAVRPAR